MNIWGDRVLISIALIEWGIVLGLLGAVWSIEPWLFECDEPRKLPIVDLIGQNEMNPLFSKLMTTYPSSSSRFFASFQAIIAVSAGANVKAL